MFAENQNKGDLEGRDNFIWEIAVTCCRMSQEKWTGTLSPLQYDFAKTRFTTKSNRRKPEQWHRPQFYGHLRNKDIYQPHSPISSYKAEC